MTEFKTGELVKYNKVAIHFSFLNNDIGIIIDTKMYQRFGVIWWVLAERSYVMADSEIERFE